MKTRIISGAAVFAAALVLFYVGGAALTAAYCIFSLIGLFELLRVFGIHKKAAAFAVYGVTLLYFILLYFMAEEAFLPCAVLLVLACLLIYVFSYPRYHIEEITKGIFSFFYVPVMMSFVCLVRGENNGWFYVWMILLSSWGCDTMAYFTGVFFGKHKMTPVLSPKKTWEGAAGGILGAALLTFVFSLIFRNRINEGTGFCIAAALSAAAAAVLSMVGDLAASGIKRNYGIKDYGNLIPGHGGILDRFDSMMFTAPVIYFAVHYLL